MIRPYETLLEAKIPCNGCALIWRVRITISYSVMKHIPVYIIRRTVQQECILSSGGVWNQNMQTAGVQLFTSDALHTGLCILHTFSQNKNILPPNKRRNKSPATLCDSTLPIRLRCIMTTCIDDDSASAPPPMAHFRAGPSPDATIVRIIHHAPPDLSYKVHIRPVPTGSSTPNPPLTTHTFAEEPSLIDFLTSTFSFNNYGPFKHFLSQHSPSAVASITKVQWEAYNEWDVAGSATLTVAKMLVERLPELQEVVVGLVMGRSMATQEILRNLVEKWVEGLKELKEGLKVAVVTKSPEVFEWGMRGGTVRGVRKDVKKIFEAKSVGEWR